MFSIASDMVETFGWEAAIDNIYNTLALKHGSDSEFNVPCEVCENATYDCENCQTNQALIGPIDHDQMMQLLREDPFNVNFRSMIFVHVEIEAPIYWWKDFESSYKNGVVLGPYSVINQIRKKPFELDDFVTDHLDTKESLNFGISETPMNMTDIFKGTVETLNHWRRKFFRSLNPDKRDHYWQQIVQLLPASYCQKRTLIVSYETLSQVFVKEQNRKMSEWIEFCDWIKTLPYSEFIIPRKETEE